MLLLWKVGLVGSGTGVGRGVKRIVVMSKGLEKYLEKPCDSRTAVLEKKQRKPEAPRAWPLGPWQCLSQPPGNRSLV